MKTILTGIRANSDLTLGNYLGSLLPTVRLANKYADTHKIIVLIPDLHSIISGIDGHLRENIYRMINYYLTAGLNIHHPHVYIVRQSHIPGHTELAWVLNCIASVGEMSRMTQYKEKSKWQRGPISAGIFNYPILMAADILLYDADYVPVGEDQFQHLELTRNLAIRFNNRFGETFVVPEPVEKTLELMELDAGIRIRDLQNPQEKMSKSTSSNKGKIMLSDSPEQAAKKIMSATTDSLGEIDYDFETRPGISNLLTIEALSTSRPIKDVVERWRGNNHYGDLKKEVASSVRATLSVFRQDSSYWTNERIESYLVKCERLATATAYATIQRVYRRLELSPSILSAF